MPSYQSIQTFLCKTLKVSKTEAFNFIYQQQVKINKINAKVNDPVYRTDEVSYHEIIIQKEKKYKYYKLYKPRGIECTLNKLIKNNLHTIFKIEEGFTYVGRLDKESEGLILITNNGSFNNNITRKNNKIEKEYIVKVDKEIDSAFLLKMSQGIQILGKITLPCKVDMVSNYEFKIILTEGINRQIRRMCYKLNYQVTELKRTRIGNIMLEKLASGEMVEIINVNIEN